jgi:hypothetical protein
MTWNGKHRIEAIRYTVKSRGVVVRRGEIGAPGGALIRHEPVKIEIPIPDEPPARLEVVIKPVG